ncbi:MAG: hypothetical protein ACI9HK_004954, partial [Pirellulaceae bacterium]
MTVLAFVPDPDCAVSVVAWTDALKESADVEYICLE